MRCQIRLLFLLLCMSVVACTQHRNGPPSSDLPDAITSSGSSATSGSAAADRAATSAAADETAKVALRTASWDELQAEIQQHAGKVLVVDLWSTW